MIKSDDMKECSKCHIVKPIIEFYTNTNKHGQVYPRGSCKVCTNATNSKYIQHRRRIDPAYKEYCDSKNLKNNNAKMYRKRQISGCFWFLNNSFISKMHPTRDFTTELKIKGRGHRLYTPCRRCGRKTNVLNSICVFCQAEDIAAINTEELKSIRIQAMLNADKHTNLLKDCSTHGTCDVLAAHHEMLEGDPDRLTTQFLVGLICKKEYSPGNSTRMVMRKGRK